MKKRRSNNPGGRPLLGAERRQRYQIMLEPAVAERLRAHGRGNLSAGIAQAEAIASRQPPPF